MKKKVVLLFVGLMLTLVLGAQVQVEQTILQKAVAGYNIGNFKEVIALLQNNISHWPIEERCQAWRLLALSYLATDRLVECREMVREMLEIEPYYTVALQDPLRFVRLVREIQSGKISLVTASQQAESPEEAPVPVTIITREMLTDIGARTLKDALLAYVPGMNHVESANEVNIAMRGIFSSGQQKMLIMLNGHRLNSRSTNGANPDYSISLEKVRQIEVLRGPASSLYGNVALTAVVNVITRDGSQADGLEVELGTGNWGQKQLSVIFGRRFMDAEFMTWGTFFESDGQVVKIPREQAVIDPFTVEQRAGQAIIEGYKDLPSYDIGLTCSRKIFSLLFNRRYCKRIDPFATVSKGQGAWYTYEKYRKVNGMGVGYGVTNTQAELAWNSHIGNWKLNGNIGLDWGNHHQMATAGDYMRGYISDGEVTYNNLQLVTWQEYTLGGVFKVSHNYTLGRVGQGNVLVGFQMEHLKVYASDCSIWKDFTTKLVELKMLQTGQEDSYSFFSQIKHYLSDHWIVNGGIRADCKIRADQKRIFAISPRIALIWLPGGQWHFKGSVSRAFVDAPYFYRYTDLPTFKADSSLRPEYLTSIQFSYGWNKAKGVRYEGNCFYNSLTDMIYRDKTVLDASEPYKNAGLMRVIGWENTLNYTGERWRTNWNISAMMALNERENVCGKGKIYNIPPLTFTGVASYCIWKGKKEEIWFQADGKCMIKQSSPIKNIFLGREVKPKDITDGNEAISLPGYCLPTCWLINMGISGYWRKMKFSIHGYNVFNRIYTQGGSTLLPYRQPGRSVMIKVGVKLN